MNMVLYNQSGSTKSFNILDKMVLYETLTSPQFLGSCDLYVISTSLIIDKKNRGVYPSLKYNFLARKVEMMAKFFEVVLNKTLALMSPNLYARYLYGNIDLKLKGIKNMHVNIRSIGNKVFEIKRILKEYQPHIMGVSECEVKKVDGLYDETRLKIPGYKLFFPKSWKSHGFARVLVYVRKSFSCEQIEELEDDLFQSIWLKGGLRNGKQILFAHAYREHTSTIGNSIRVQRDNLKIFLN